MQTMQAMTAIHKPSEQPTTQQSKASEKGAFSEQLVQSMAQKATSNEESVKEDTAEESQLEGEETSQQTEQLDSTEDQINPNLAFFFQRPLVTAEHQLAVQFGQVPVADELGQEKMQQDKGSFPVENSVTPLSNLEEVAKASKPLMPEENQQTRAVSIDGKEEAVNTGVKSLLATTPQKQDKFVEESNSSPEKLAVPFLSDESLDKKSSGKEVVLPSEIQEAATAKDGLAVEQKKVTLNAGQQNTVVDSPIIMEASAEMKQTQAVAVAEKNDISDLDIQSDFRLQVTAAKTSETPFAQQPVMQREVQVPVGLTSESQSVNQQVLSQAISEVVIDQVTTLKDGQQTTARLSLTPETLGHIKIELKMIDNQLQTTMVVESVETKELLDKSMQQLTNSLAQKNIQLNDVSIQLSLPQESSFTFAESGSQQNTQQQDSEQSAMYFDPVEELNQPKGSEEETSSAGRLSILA